MDMLRTLAHLCCDPNHIDLDGKARGPKNLPRVPLHLE